MLMHLSFGLSKQPTRFIGTTCAGRHTAEKLAQHLVDLLGISLLEDIAVGRGTREALPRAGEDLLEPGTAMTHPLGNRGGCRHAGQFGQHNQRQDQGHTGAYSSFGPPILDLFTRSIHRHLLNPFAPASGFHRFIQHALVHGSVFPRFLGHQ